MDLLEDLKGGEYAIHNNELRETEEYVQELYMRILCTIIHYNGEGTREQLFFFKRILAGINKDYNWEDYLRKSFEITQVEIQEFITYTQESKLKYYFTLDSLIIASLSKNTDSIYEYVAEIINFMEIDRRDVVFLSLIAKAVVTQKYIIIKNANKKITDNTIELNFEEYLTGIFDEDIIYDLENKAEELFKSYNILLLLPVLEELCIANNHKAQYMLALLYETGAEGIMRNTDMATKLLEQSFGGGYLPAKVRMFIPLHTKEIDDDICKLELPCLVENIKKMADEGDIFAAEELARIYINAHYVNMDRDEGYKKAIYYFKKAPAPLGYYGLAIRYEQGNGVTKDLEVAFEYYVASAAFGYAKAEYCVGMAYQYGYGVKIDKNRAFDYYKRAYKHGEKDAINSLGWCLTNNFGTENDYDKAFELFMEGAKIGLSVPTANVGWCYQNGRGVDKNMDIAKKYYQKAAEMGNNWAQEQLDEYF
jgi:hypothetical protein